MVNLDEATIEKIDAMAAAARLSRSAMIRKLVAEA
jgi:metal-responsive CopG/Arc/MetJ family transcriptional regulator